MSDSAATWLTIAQYVSILESIYEFNQEWNRKYKMYDNQVRKLIKEGHTYYIDFLKFLILVRTSCTNGCAALNNIKLELEIAVEEEIFERNILLEIQETSKQLQTIFESLHQQTKVMKKFMLKFNDNLRHENKLIKNERCDFPGILIFNAVSSAAMSSAALVGASLSNYLPDRAVFFGAGGGALSYTVLANTMKNDKLQKQKKLIHVLEQVEDKVNPLFSSVDKSSVHMHDIRENILIFVNSINKIVSNNAPQIEHRVVIKAKGMIDTVNKLTIKLKDIEKDTIHYSEILRTQIRQENPRSLIDL